MRSSCAASVINHVPSYRRNIAMVFQHYAMFSASDRRREYRVWTSREDGSPAARLRSRVDEMVTLLQLGGLERRYPAQLSGGTTPAWSRSRAPLAIRPDMLLLDEAFSALDRNLREDMQLEMSLLLRRLRVTTILVTQ